MSRRCGEEKQQRRWRKDFPLIQTQNYFHLQDGKELRVPALEMVLLKLSLTCFKLTLHVEKVLVPYSYREVSRIFLLES